jgi:hypothetical protein
MNNFSYDLTLPSPFGEGFMELFINSNNSPSPNGEGAGG